MTEDPLKQRRELAERAKAHTESEHREDTLYGSQSADYTVGGQNIWSDNPELNEDLHKAIEQEDLHTVPAKVRLRNRGDRPLTILSNYNPSLDLLQMEVIQKAEPQLPLTKAVRAWVRSVVDVGLHGTDYQRAKAGAEVLLVAGSIASSLAVILLGVLVSTGAL